MHGDRIGDRFRGLAARGRPGFIPYVTAGYPCLDQTRDLLAGLVEAEADVIELGIPFSDPMADGPTIQRSSQGALDQGTRLEHVLGLVSELRRWSEVPVVIFSYLNPMLSRGAASFLADAQEAGVDGILPTDLPMGADIELEAMLMESPLDLIRLVAPTTTPDRVREIVRSSQGFVYYIARTGVTGARTSVRGELAREVGLVCGVSSVPVAVGFGISTAAQAAVVGGVADAVVVGSALVDSLDAGGVEGALRLAREIRGALDQAAEHTARSRSASSGPGEPLSQ